MVDVFYRKLVGFLYVRCTIIPWIRNFGHVPNHRFEQKKTPKKPRISAPEKSAKKQTLPNWTLTKLEPMLSSPELGGPKPWIFVQLFNPDVQLAEK